MSLRNTNRKSIHTERQPRVRKKQKKILVPGRQLTSEKKTRISRETERTAASGIKVNNQAGWVLAFKNMSRFYTDN